MFQGERKENSNSGFSLFETLIFIIVWSLLALGSYLVIPPLLLKARDTQRKTHLYKLSRALDQYYELKKEFPDSLPDCGQPFSTTSSAVLASIPCDPSLKTPYLYQKYDEAYRLYTNLENTRDPIITDIKCHYGCGPDCAYNYGVSSSNLLLENCLPPPVDYACSPGGGSIGNCEQYDDPELSQCPKVYVDDPTCDNECGNPNNRCKNASGKHTPE
jgi:Tfp pilus assembly protein PilE